MKAVFFFVISVISVTYICFGDCCIFVMSVVIYVAFHGFCDFRNFCHVRDFVEIYVRFVMSVSFCYFFRNFLSFLRRLRFPLNL